MDQRYELIIIGSGPAGMTAAIYAGRAGLRTLMLEAMAPGGKLIKTAQISNWPGDTGTSGVDLAMRMYEHSTYFKAESQFNEVTQVKDDDGIKTVICKDGTRYTAAAVIIATGTTERLLHIPNEEQLVGKGVSYCAVCDGNFFKDKVVTVIGGGNSALEESLYLSTLVKKLYIVIRRDSFRADAIIQGKVMTNPKITVIKKHVPKAIGEIDGMVGYIILEDVDTKAELRLATDGIFPYIGADPNTEMVRGLGITDDSGYLVVNAQMETAVAGIYGAGDVNAKYLRQVVTATADGAIAAQSAFHYIKK